MCSQFSLFGCLTGLYFKCPVLLTGSKYWFSTFSRGNVGACAGLPELISHLDVLGEGEHLPMYLVLLYFLWRGHLGDLAHVQGAVEGTGCFF